MKNAPGHGQSNPTSKRFGTTHRKSISDGEDFGARLRSRTFFLVILSLLVAGPGCQLLMKSGARPSPDVPKDIAANQNQTRLRMRALVQPMCGELEKTADAIIASTTNRAVQLAAVRWRIERVPRSD